MKFVRFYRPFCGSTILVCSCLPVCLCCLHIFLISPQSIPWICICRFSPLFLECLFHFYIQIQRLIRCDGNYCAVKGTWVKDEATQYSNNARIKRGNQHILLCISRVQCPGILVVASSIGDYSRHQVSRGRRLGPDYSAGLSCRELAIGSGPS